MYSHKIQHTGLSSFHYYFQKMPKLPLLAHCLFQLTSVKNDELFTNYINKIKEGYRWHLHLKGECMAFPILEGKTCYLDVLQKIMSTFFYKKGKSNYEVKKNAYQ